MRGYPEHLNSKQDYLNMLEFDKEETLRRLEALLATRFYWVRGQELGEGEEGIEDERHNVRAATDIPIGFNSDTKDSIEKRYQYELQENEHALIFHLGFRVEEVEQLIKENKE